MESRVTESGSSGGEESFLLLYLCFVGSILYLLWLRRDKTRYRNIPTVGFSWTLTSFISALLRLNDQTGVIRKGYTKFSNGVFRYPTLARWIVVIAKPKLVEELRKAPEEEVSAAEAMNEILGIPCTINSGLLADPELKSLLGAQLTRNLHEFPPDLHSVVVSTVNELVSSEDDDWKYIEETDVMTQICCRTINRILVGASLSQNAQFLEQANIFSCNLERYARNVKRCPGFLRSFYTFLFTPIPRIKCKLYGMIADVVKERNNLVKSGEDTPQNDMITWFADHDEEMTVDELVAHVLLVNYLAVRPMVQIMSQALRNLAIHSDRIKSLRTEVEDTTRQGGWTKSSIDKMRLIDAFIKETMRLDPNALNPDFPGLTMARKCRRPVTFSDGTTIPQNALLFVGSQLLHTDARYYPRPSEFNPQRFVSSLESDFRPPQISPAPSSDSYIPISSWASTSSSTASPVSLTLPATSSTFLGWGHGKHACPGRFFAASVMKFVLAHFVFDFDFRLPPLHGSGGGEKQSTRTDTQKILWIEIRNRRQSNPGST
ncbi:Ent-kaurene oxidase [Leucoagaricus sp. SymC.cos]|nr:Ent-kaurene oxidase [Leucoagaricus sp. SymC.cos]